MRPKVHTFAGQEPVPVRVTTRYEVWSEPTEAGKERGIEPRKLGGPYEVKSYANWVKVRELGFHDGVLHNIVIKVTNAISDTAK